MLFKRFFDKRKRASQTPGQADRSKSQEMLKEQALKHADVTQRRAALQQLSDPTVLVEILAGEADCGMREAAVVRLRDVLCQDPCHDTPAEVFTELFARIADSGGLLEHLARHGQRPEVRRLALERIDSSAVLVDCAVEDRLAANRALAAERLEDKSALEALLARIGKRDKNVHRIAREKLRLIGEREALPHRVRAQCEDLYAKLERLGHLGNWTQDRALLEHLDRQWAQIETAAEPQWRDRVHAERERFLTAYETHCRNDSAQRTARADETLAREQAEALLAELADLCARGEEGDTLERERIATAWHALPVLSGPHALNARYAALERSAAAAQQARADQRQHSARLATLSAKAERLLGESKLLDQTALNALLDEGQTLAASESESDQAKAFLALSQRLAQRLSGQRDRAANKLAQCLERLDVLETHLAAGELKKADPIYHSLQAGLDLVRASGIDKREEAKLANRLRTLAPKLRELQQWRRWAADQHREALCAAMEELIEQELPLAALAERLRALQADWKRLDKTGSPPNQALWQRFQSASDAVYARCRPFMEAQSAEREANRRGREAVCEQLEDFLSKVDWERVDWKRILQAKRMMRQTWGLIGPTEGRHRKQLERRFHQSLRALDKRLDAERKRNQTHKRTLIEQARELIELPDLDSAIEQTKALQRNWHTTVAARQKDENKLWQSFRAACDAVFERRAAVQQAQTSELEANLHTRQAICEEAAKITAHEQDPGQLAAAQRDLTDRWRAAERLPVPRQSVARLTRAWRESHAQLERCRRGAEARQRSASLELLAHQADLCQRLERSLLDADPDTADLHAIQAAWSGLERQADPALQAAIEQRFERALAVAENPEKLAELRADNAANAEVLNRMCLQLEIIAGVESPPALSQQRLEFQVARLSERMTEGEEDPLQGATRLLHEWYLCGPAPCDAGLTARFARVRETLLQRQRESEAA